MLVYKLIRRKLQMELSSYLYSSWRCQIMKQMLHALYSQFFHQHNISATLSHVFLSCILILSACGGSNSSKNTTSAPTKKGGNINVVLIAEPTTLDPLTSTS